MSLPCTAYDRCFPMVITDSHDDSYGRLGGSPPVGLAVGGGHTYFATVIIAREPDTFVSIFVVDYQTLSSTRGAVNDLDHVRLYAHQYLPRSDHTTTSSSLSAHNLLLLPECSDLVQLEDGSQMVRPGHKVGGKPLLIRTTPSLITQIQLIEEQGFQHLLQFDFPDSEDAVVSGDWPFGDGLFGLFGRTPYGAGDWRWIWDF